MEGTFFYILMLPVNMVIIIIVFFQVGSTLLFSSTKSPWPPVVCRRPAVSENMASQEICIICNEPITVDRSTLTERGIQTVLTISAELEDGLDKTLVNATLPVPAHKKCKNNYTKPSNVKKMKKTY